MFAAWLVTSAALNGSGLMINPYLAVAVIFIVGIVIGWFNGLLIVYLGLNAFIATLAMLILLRGVTIGMTNGRTLYDLPAPFLYLGNAAWLGIPATVWLAAALNAAGAGFLSVTRWGRALYAIGGNAEAARAAGIPCRPLCLERVCGRWRTGGVVRTYADRPNGLRAFRSGAEHDLYRVRRVRDRPHQFERRQRLDSRRALRSDPARHHFKYPDIVEHSDLLDFGDLRSDYPVVLDPHAPNLRQILPERLTLPL